MASAASIMSPTSRISFALPAPISPGSSAASITEGRPTLTSGMPNFAVSDATRKSQLAMISSPAPRA